MGDKIIGVSAHTIEEARFAIENGADYLGVGPISQRVRKKRYESGSRNERISLFLENKELQCQSLVLVGLQLKIQRQL